MSESVFRVLIADNVAPECSALFAGDARFEVVEEKLRGDELLEAIGGFHALIVRSGCQVTAEVLERAERLKVVVRAGVGVDNIDLAAATKRGVLVMNTPQGNTISAAEHTLALMLGLCRNIAPADAAVRAGGWRTGEHLGTELRGKTLGVVGLGKIGREVAERARGFGMTLIGFDPVLTQEAATAIGVRLVSLDELYAEADIITLHVPLNDKTRNMLNTETLGRLKSSCRIVNCARGGIINEAALAEALNAGQIAGAAIDVYETEPVPADHPLKSAKNCLLTPHLGASTVEAQETVGILSGKQVRAYLLDGEIRNAVNTLTLDAGEARQIGPFMELGTKLGTLHAQLLPGSLKRISVTCSGEAFETPPNRTSRTRLTTLAVLEGFFKHYTDGPVNRVSVPQIAKDQGIVIDEREGTDTRGFENLVSVKIEAGDETRMIAGALFGENARLVFFDSYKLDATPEGRALIFKNFDRPGMLGKICAILGEAGVNIANVNLGRDESGGTALAFMNIDSALAEETVRSLEEVEGLPWVRTVSF